MLKNVNSSGQGFSDDHNKHPLFDTIVNNGYVYSHSVYVTNRQQNKILYHCFKCGQHNVMVIDTNAIYWETSVSCASSHRWTGNGQSELNSHLNNKKKRYKL